MGETEVTVGLWNAVMNMNQQKYLNSKDIEDVEKPKTGSQLVRHAEFIAKLNKANRVSFQFTDWHTMVKCRHLWQPLNTNTQRQK